MDYESLGSLHGFIIIIMIMVMIVITWHVSEIIKLCNNHACYSV